MDFFRVEITPTRNGAVANASYRTIGFHDLMVRGNDFYAIWDEQRGLWSTDEDDLVRVVDDAIEREASKSEVPCQRKFLSSSTCGGMAAYRDYLRMIRDRYVPLDEKIIFADEPVTREDYVSRRLPYSRSTAEPSCYNELMSVLYSPEERNKLEWGIGSIFVGDSKKIQKCFALFGDPGTGKSTVLNIIEMLFDGYCRNFDCSELVAANSPFAMEALSENPLIAIDHDTKLNRVRNNSRLNTVISHETVVVNQKYKKPYTMRMNPLIFVGTNTPVEITDAKSGLIRRLIDVHPTGNRIPFDRYQELLSGISKELGQIANRCMKVYEDLGRKYYDDYIPEDMINRTNFFQNFIDEYAYELSREGYITLRQAYDMFKVYCEESGVDRPMKRMDFRDNLRNYFERYIQDTTRGGKHLRCIFEGFKMDKSFVKIEEEHESWIKLEEQESVLDKMLADCPAQYGGEGETPNAKWENVTTILKDLDTTRLHYVRVPENHIVIDFDLKNEKGEKDLEQNIRAASEWPRTYCEVSKGGQGLHLHYLYDGDLSQLVSKYAEGIEIKVFRGLSSLRRRVSLCTNLAVAVISSGLPLKEVKNVVDFEKVQDEQHLRNIINKCLHKEVHANTTPNVQFIHNRLEAAYRSHMSYDVRDLQQQVLRFAMKSTHQSKYCLNLVSEMHFCSKDVLDQELPENKTTNVPDEDLVFFDCEVFPNLFLVNWKRAGEGQPIIRMINPSSQDIESLMRLPLVGFNNRKYDNHILYARYVGKSVEELYHISQLLISGKGGTFNESYNLSYTDIYDFASAGHKKSLKKWEIELGLKHQELNLPWDEPVDESKWLEVAEYCDNDVISTEAVFLHLRGDWAARKILAELSGLTPNDTTNQCTTRLIFGTNKNPQLNWSDLSERFPGYTFDKYKRESTYRGEVVGEGGYVYAVPGMYWNIKTFDVVSMHPTSLTILGYLGEYTQTYADLRAARVAIKHKDRDALSKLLGGRLTPYLDLDDQGLKDLSNALKTALNSVYGLTAAKFDNPFRDPRNDDNIVAKCGALFMMDLKAACLERGYKVVHIKTDSIKIENPTKECCDFIMEFGKSYGYEFEIESEYDCMCLVNDAVYIARDAEHQEWTATGAQFAEPYVFKTLFTGEDINYEDLWQTKSVTKGAIYLGDEFVGRVGAFVPVISGGRELTRRDGDKISAVTGTKGYLWRQAAFFQDNPEDEIETIGYGAIRDTIDWGYYEELARKAREAIEQYGDFDMFVEDLPF